MITIFIEIVIAALVLGLVVFLAQQVPFLAPFARIIQVVAIVLFVIWVLFILMGLLGHMPATLPTR